MSKNNKFIIYSSSDITGECEVSSDKSILQRTIILGAISDNNIFIKYSSIGEDCLNLIKMLKQLGVKIDINNIEKLICIYGVGLYGFKKPEQELYAGNSGTALRLLTGILVAQRFDSIITGDESLCKRPMDRIIQPLTMMGANIKANSNKFAPLYIKGNINLNAITYKLPVASAQVKSSILLAGLYAKGNTKVIDLFNTRNHTELMLSDFKNKIIFKKSIKQIPGDISSAAFLIVAAIISEKANLIIKNVGINPTRIGFIKILNKMGANIIISNKKIMGKEPVADVMVKNAKLKSVLIEENIPTLIDEIPILMIAAACAKGTTILKNAAELKYKESNRLQAVTQGLKKIGVQVELLSDGMKVTGSKIKGGVVNSYGDHRIAMAFAIAGIVSIEKVEILNISNVATSFPQFVTIAKNIGVKIQEL